MFWTAAHHRNLGFVLREWELVIVRLGLRVGSTQTLSCLASPPTSQLPLPFEFLQPRRRTLPGPHLQPRGDPPQRERRLPPARPKPLSPRRSLRRSPSRHGERSSQTLRQRQLPASLLRRAAKPVPVHPCRRSSSAMIRSRIHDALRPCPPELRLRPASDPGGSTPGKSSRSRWGPGKPRARWPRQARQCHGLTHHIRHSWTRFDSMKKRKETA
jgi:hypothetical protein